MAALIDNPVANPSSTMIAILSLIATGRTSLKKQCAPTPRFLQFCCSRAIEPIFIQSGNFIRIGHHISVFGHCPDRVLRLEWMSDFPNDNQIQRSFERAGHFNAKYNATTRKAINNNGLAFVSDESFSKSFAGIYAIYKHVAPQSRRPSGMLARAFLGKTDHGRILELHEAGVRHTNRVDVCPRIELHFGLFR